MRPCHFNGQRSYSLFKIKSHTLFQPSAIRPLIHQELQEIAIFVGIGFSCKLLKIIIRVKVYSEPQILVFLITLSQKNLCNYDQVLMISGFGWTEGPKFDMPLKW